MSEGETRQRDEQHASEKIVLVGEHPRGEIAQHDAPSPQ
jgi:hypothetical protein